MPQKNSNKKRAMPKWFDYTVAGIMIPFLGITLYYINPIKLTKEIYQEGKTYRYAIEHLDPKAISPKESPFTNDFSTWGE